MLSEFTFELLKQKTKRLGRPFFHQKFQNPTTKQPIPTNFLDYHSLSLMTEGANEERAILSRSSRSKGFWYQIISAFSVDEGLADADKSQKINRLDAFMLLLNTMIGAGVLQQAIVFEYCGIITASFLFIIVSYFTYLGAKGITKLADVTGLTSYPQIARHALGPYGALTVDITIVIFNFTTVIVYIMYMGSLTENIVTSYYPSATQWYTSKGFYSALFTAVVVFPICLVRNFSRLTVVAYFSVAMMVMVALVLMIDGPIQYKYNGTWNVRWVSFAGSTMALGTLIYSLGFAPAILFTYEALDTKHKSSISTIVFAAVIAGTLLCYIIGIAGYLLFQDTTSSNILDNLSGTIARICDVGMIAHFALFLPSDFFIMRESLYQLTQFSADHDPYEVRELSAHNSQQHLGNEINPMNLSEAPDESEIVTDSLLDSSDSGVSIPKQSKFISVQSLDDGEYALFTVVTLSIITLTACLVDFYLGSNNTYFSFAINLVGGLAGSIDTFVIPGLCGLHFLRDQPKYFWRYWSLLVFGVVCIVLITIGSFFVIIG